MSPMAGGQNISKAASIPLVIHNAMVVSAQNGNYYTNQRVKAWEIWSCAGQQMVDTRGVVPNEGSQSHSCMVDAHCRVGGQEVCKTSSMHFIVCNARGLADVKWELLCLGTTPCVSTICLPDIILHGQICQDFPFYVWILQILEVGTAWE